MKGSSLVAVLIGILVLSSPSTAQESLDALPTEIDQRAIRVATAGVAHAPIHQFRARQFSSGVLVGEVPPREPLRFDQQSGSVIRGALIGGAIGGGVGLVAGFIADNTMTDGNYGFRRSSAEGLLIGIGAGALVGAAVSWIRTN